MKKIFETPEVNVGELAVSDGIMADAMLSSNSVDTGSIVYVTDGTDYSAAYKKWKGFGA